MHLAASLTCSVEVSLCKRLNLHIFSFATVTIFDVAVKLYRESTMECGSHIATHFSRLGRFPARDKYQYFDGSYFSVLPLQLSRSSSPSVHVNLLFTKRVLK